MSGPENDADHALRELLATRLPRPRAPDALHARMAALVEREEPKRDRGVTRRAWPRVLTAAAVFATAASVMLAVVRMPEQADSPLVHEVVNDHLRTLYARHPVEIESGGIHQVKPWFAGRLDFAPRVSVEDDADFPLQGGAVSYVIDRRAATFVYKRRLHTITLMVFPAESLPWPHGEPRKLNDTEAQAFNERGYNVLLFRRNDLAYALVSDLNMGELSELGKKLTQP